MTETANKTESCSTEAKHADKHEDSSCSTDKSVKKTEAEKSSCSTEHKQGSCGSKS